MNASVQDTLERMFDRFLNSVSEEFHSALKENDLQRAIILLAVVDAMANADLVEASKVLEWGTST